MNRRASVWLLPLALLTACGGGGGGKGTALPPTGTTPQTKKTGTATFSFGLPGKNTMARVRRPYYQSQATQGVAIDWLSSNPNVPDYAAAISAVCPATLPAGVTACTVDGQGNTDYTFQLQIPAGTYNLTVTTFDTPPSGGTFTGSMLAQGQLAAPVVIAAGTSNTIPSLTFYGVPATVSFVPGPAQSHVVTYGSNLAVIGNTPQTFFAQAEDADGFLISSNDSGAPTITVAEAASDSPQHFTVGTTADANEFTLTAVDASANAVINATATPGGTGLAAVTNAVTVTPVQELWTTQEAGTNPNGIFGYAIYPGVVSPKGPIDEYEDPIGNPLCGGGGSSCNFFEATVDPTSGVIYAVGSEDSIPQVYAFTQNAGSQGITAPAAAAYVEAAGANVEAMAIDTQHHGFIVDDNSGNVALEAYSTASSGWSSITSSTNASLTSDEAESVAVAPTAANVPSALVGTIWVGSNNGQMLVYPAFSGSSFGMPGTVNPGQSESVIGFDSAGYLWVSTGGTIYVYSVSGTAASPALTQVGTVSLVTPGAGGTSFGAAAGQHMWFGEGTGEYTGYDLYTASSCPSCSLSRSATDLATNSGSFAAFVTP